MRGEFNSWIVNLLICVVFYFYPLAGGGLAFLCILQKISPKFMIFILSLMFGLYGLVFIPGVNFDIIRHMEIYDGYTNFSFIQFIEYFMLSKQPDLLLYFFYFLSAKISSNSQYVGFIAAFLFYFLLISAIYQFCKRFLPHYLFARSFFIIFLMFQALTVTWTFSLVRNSVGIALFVFMVISYDFKRSNFFVKFLYIFPAFMHFSLFPVLGVFFLSQYLKKNTLRNLYIVMLILTPFLKILTSFLVKIFESLGGVGRFFAAKLETYILGDLDASIYSGAGLRFYLVIIPMIILCSYLLFNVKVSKNLVKSSTWDRFEVFFKTYLIYVIFTSTTYLFARAHLLFVYLATFYLVYIFSMSYERKNIINKIVVIFIFWTILSFLPSLITGNEFLGVNEVLFFSDLETIMNETVPESKYWKP